ncbi:MAG: fatty acid desaturase, partial [Myxococcota bacterium]
RHEVGYEPSRWQTFFFLMFKVNFVFWGLAVPLYLHPWYLVLPIFLAIQMTVSLILSLVFQFAHVVDGVAMPSLDEEASIDNQWAVHQITTTANFAVNNPFVRWYAGGLNCQIEHHLFTGISHVRYPHIQPVVQEVCAEYNIPYQCYPTVWSAFRAHMRQLVAMSHEPPEPAHELPSQDTALSVG